MLPPVLPSEFASAMLAVAVAFIYHQIGIAGDRPVRRRPGHLPVPARRSCCSPSSAAEELETRSKQLASFQVGMLSAMLRTLDLRDQMTARHSAAVARYSRAIAQRAGYSRQEEELVHIAALLHDIGKFILPDRILKANVPLTDEDWMLIRATRSRAPAWSPRSTATGRWRRSSSPTTSGSTAKAIPAAWPATTSPSWRGSSPSPTPTT